MVELHCAHGYLLSAFITPLMNRRTDAYGGPLENRLRFPLEVFAAMRAVWPEHKPMSVRISATDWVEGGITGDDAVEIARSVRGRRRRHHRRLRRPDQHARQAYLRAHVPDAVCRPHPQRGRASRPWRSATSSSPITSTASSPPGAPTSAASRAHTSPTPTGHCMPPRSLAMTRSPGRCNICRGGSSRAQSQARG